MRGVKYQILGLGIILLGMTVPSVSHISYICGALGFGLAVIGCFCMRDMELSLIHISEPTRRS